MHSVERVESRLPVDHPTPFYPDNRDALPMDKANRKLLTEPDVLLLTGDDIGADYKALIFRALATTSS